MSNVTWKYMQKNSCIPLTSFKNAAVPPLFFLLKPTFCQSDNHQNLQHMQKYGRETEETAVASAAAAPTAFIAWWENRGPNPAIVLSVWVVVRNPASQANQKEKKEQLLWTGKM